jgi:stage V sporulation protein AC
MKNITNKEYDAMVKKASPGSKSLSTIPRAFLTGGAICALAQGFANLYSFMGSARDDAYAMTSVTLIFIAAMLTGLNIFDNIAEFGGAGTLVPITGFANAVASPALEFKTEGYILGIGGRLFAIAGPVIVYGLTSGVVYGLILYIFRLY